MTEDDDAIAVRACLNGNRQAFAVLVERYDKPVYNVALRMLRSPDDARDVTQTTFLKAFQNLANYDPGFKFYSWIYRIAINEALNSQRVRRRETGPVDETYPSGEPAPEESLAEDDARRQLFDAIAKLKPEYRAVIVLRYFIDRSYEDIGQILAIEEKTVKSRLFTARQLLKDLLPPQGAT